jgi:hypothetical protein
MGKLRDIDGWLRNRLRYCIWYDWKNCSEAKITNTKKVIKKHELNSNERERISRLGVDRDHSYAWSSTRNALHSRTPKKQ